MLLTNIIHVLQNQRETYYLLLLSIIIGIMYRRDTCNNLNNMKYLYNLLLTY